MLTWKSKTSVHNLFNGGPLLRRIKDHLSCKLSTEDFFFPSVLTKATEIAGVPIPSDPEKHIPNYRWWNKLCDACGLKHTSPYGGHLLHNKLVHSLSQVLAIEELYRLNKNEIDIEVIDSPFFVISLPRSNAHMAAHVLGCSGVFRCTRQCDTFTPSLMSDLERQHTFEKHFRFFKNTHPDFTSIRVLNATQIDDDVNLQSLTPQSYAWGLLHGLDEYLMECIEEDQTVVYTQIKRILQLFQWYERCGNFTFSLTREVNDIDNLAEMSIMGMKDYFTNRRFLIYSPFAILNSEILHNVFANAHVIWVHRDISQSLPSLCSSLCIYDALYTGMPPSESQLASMSDKVLGIFGSGTENAVEFYGEFAKERLIHWSNRDVKRSAERLAMKTLRYCNIDVDRFRRIQIINGATEYISCFRPTHDAQMHYFTLNEGIIGERFRNYIYQFNEFAFEPKETIKINEFSQELELEKKYRTREQIISDTYTRPRPITILPTSQDDNKKSDSTPNLTLPEIRFKS